MINPEDTLPPGSASGNAAGAAAHESNPPLPRPRRVYDTRLRSGDTLGDIGAAVSAAVPPTRRFVRRHPYAGLLGAALVGVWLVRGKPLHALSRSLVLVLAARRFLTFLPSGVLGRLRPAPPSRGASNRPR